LGKKKKAPEKEEVTEGALGKEYDEKLAEVFNDPKLKKELKSELSSGIIITGEDELEEGDIKPLVTRFESLNMSIGIGGLPRGSIIELSGKEGGFKSSLCWAIAGDVQREGGIVAWIDAEAAVDLRVPKIRRYISSLGVDYSKVILIRPQTAEKAFKVAAALAKNPNIELIIFDSVVALSNQREYDADIEKTDRNTLAMTINKSLRRIAGMLKQSDCIMILINQLRVNQDRRNKYDAEFQTTGGQGLKHWCSLRLFSKTFKIKTADKRTIGKQIYIKVTKTRYDFERDDAQLFYYNASGFSTTEEILQMAIDWGILEQVKASYTYTPEDDEEIKMTKVKWLDRLDEDEDLKTEIVAEIEKTYEEYYAPDSTAESEVAADIDDDDDEDDEEDE
jgi:recombination protein RecA